MRRALGKGLSMLIAESSEATTGEAPIDAIVPNPRQPRRHFDDAALEELAASIREVGVIQPLVVRPIAEGRYELIAGERRLRASKLAGLKSVPIVVRAAGEQTSLQLALIENVQREDISPLECARAYRQLIDDFSMTQEQVGQVVGKSRVTITNTLRLLQLPAEAIQALSEGLIQEGHARALLAAEGPERQIALLRETLAKGLSVREVENRARGEAPTRGPKRAPAPGKPAPADWRPLEEGLSTYFGAPVRLSRGAVGGQMTIEFYSDDDLQRILDILGVSL